MPVLPDEQFQHVEINGLFPSELQLDPPFLRRLYLDNILRRSLSLTSAMSTAGQKLLVATPAGILKVAITGAGFEAYEVDSTTAADAYNATNTLTPASLSSRWDILVETHDAIVHWRNLGDTAYVDDIILPIGAYSFDIASVGIQWRNRTPGSNAVVQVVGWS